jgi:hypothetical protein
MLGDHDKEMADLEFRQNRLAQPHPLKPFERDESAQVSKG